MRIIGAVILLGVCASGCVRYQVTVNGYTGGQPVSLTGSRVFVQVNDHAPNPILADEVAQKLTQALKGYILVQTPTEVEYKLEYKYGIDQGQTVASTQVHSSSSYILTGGSDTPYRMQADAGPEREIAVQHRSLRASESSAFAELVRLEIQNEVIANTVYKASGLNMLLAQIGLAIGQRHIPSSEEERETLNSAFKNIVYFTVKEATPEAFWEKNLSEFLAKNLSTQEVEEVLKVYPALDQVRAGRKLSRLRPQFVSEVSPLWQEVLKARIQSFKLPSGGMIPTLLSGDHIVVDKFAYQLKEPGRGDIVVFRYPEDETKIFIKRIIGLPGDVVEIRNKVVYVNGVRLDDRAYTQRIDPGFIDGSVNPRDNFGPITVPEGSYFVMGDNRDQSLDSRFWGYVQTSKIIGRAWMIYWSWGSDGGSRWERIGMRLQ